MKEEKSLSIKIIHDARAADTLVNPMTLRQLAPFLAQTRTVSDVALETGEKANTVLSRVRRFVALGLLEVASLEQRPGRPIKHYRTSADSFFVPYEATTAETLESLMAERDSYYETLLRQGVVITRIHDIGTWGTRIYRDDKGRLQIQTAVTPDHNYTMIDPERPAVISAWRDSVYLDFADAKALQREMFDLLERYQQKEGAQRYIIRLGLAPVLP
jgi:hypothetical protein